MSMQKLALAIAIVTIMAKMAILAISAMAIGIKNMVILGILLKSITKLLQWCKIPINWTFHSDVIAIFVTVVTMTIVTVVTVPVTVVGVINVTLTVTVVKVILVTATLISVTVVRVTVVGMILLRVVLLTVTVVVVQ